MLDAAKQGISPSPAQLPEPGVGRWPFWVNAYNACVIAAKVRGEVTGDLRAQTGFFKRAGLVVNEQFCSLHVIEHGLLRLNRPAPWTFWKPLSSADPRVAWGPPTFDPRIHFALNCGARSCPPIRAYTAEAWEQQITLAAVSYLSQETEVGGSGIRLPYLLKLYGRDFPNPLNTVRAHLPEITLPEDPVISWRAYDWTISEP